MRRLWRDPVGVLRRRVAFYWAGRRYGTGDGYDASGYWAMRLGRHRFQLRGVGCDNLTEQENARMYDGAKAVVLGLCQDEGVDLRTSRVLDIGCGTGFYTAMCAAAGATSYTGIDITDVLHDELRGAHPSYSFVKADVGRDEIDGEYDVVLMIDVTQHITVPAQFSQAMSTVRRVLADDGVFLVTSWLDPGRVSSFAERARGMSDYRREFPGFRIGTPRPFRDKFIFSIRREGGAGTKTLPE